MFLKLKRTEWMMFPFFIYFCLVSYWIFNFLVSRTPLITVLGTEWLSWVNIRSLLLLLLLSILLLLLLKAYHNFIMFYVWWLISSLKILWFFAFLHPNIQWKKRKLCRWALCALRPNVEINIIFIILCICFCFLIKLCDE